MEPVFKQNWLGRRVADPLLVTIGVCTTETMYQCVSLIKEYLKEDYNLDVPYPGNAVDFWYKTNATLLTKFYRVESSEAIQGDIVVLHTLGYTDGTEPGHIGIATGNIDASNVEILEQNGATGGGTGLGGDAIRTRYVPRTRVAGLLRPTMSPVPPPAPINPVTYQDAPEAPHDVQVNKVDTPWWDLNDNPITTSVTTLPLHHVFTIGGFGLHANGYKYALIPSDYAAAKAGDMAHNVGVNVDDLEEIPAPVPVPPPAPPTAPVAYTPATTYTVVTSIPGFKTSQDALMDTNAVQAVKAAVYTQYGETVKGQIPLLVNPSSNPKLILWINPNQNKIEETPRVPIISQPSPTVATTQGIPASPTVAVTVSPKLQPTQWRETYKPFYTADPMRSIMYEANLDFTIEDLGGQRPDIQVQEDKRFGIYGTFTGPDGVKYFRAKMNYDTNFEYWYGIPVKHPETGFSYIVPVSLFLVLPKPVQNLWAMGVGSAERYIDNVKTKFRSRR